MQKRIEVIDARTTNKQKIELSTADSQFENVELKATGQMLVDSDSKSFIYILENDDQYIYVSLPEKIWPALQQILEHDDKVFLKVNGHEIELTEIRAELLYLISNIEGNANYGDDMVKRVEEVFLNRQS